MNGYAGKILRLDLTDANVSTIPTSDYEQWGGGHGMGSAIFFDLVKDKTIDGFDPANVVTIMTSPLCGTLVPGAAAGPRCRASACSPIPSAGSPAATSAGGFRAMLNSPGGTASWSRARPTTGLDRHPGRRGADPGCSGLSLWGKDTRETQEPSGAMWPVARAMRTGGAGRSKGTGSHHAKTGGAHHRPGRREPEPGGLPDP